MVYTVTLNPSIDYSVQLSHPIDEGAVNRMAGQCFYPGGKGINVSLVLASLGIATKATGFLGGFTGTELSRMLVQSGCENDFVFLNDIRSATRINIKLQLETDTENTEINAQGPGVISDSEQQALLNKIGNIKAGDFLVLAGSIPKALPKDFYLSILDRLPSGVEWIADTDGITLESLLAYRPFLIKPNHHELGQLFSVAVTSLEQAACLGKQLQLRGARNVLISMGSRGAVMVWEDGTVCLRSLPSKALPRRAVMPVGSGDSMVAGFLAGIHRYGGDMRKVVDMAVASGTATAFAPWLASGAEIEGMFKFLNDG